MKRLYLALAVLGAVVPYAFFLQQFAAEGLSLRAFVAALFANPAAGGFTADLLLSSGVFWIAIFRQHSRGRGPHPAPYVLLNLLVGLSCALPAYLYARLRAEEPTN